MKKRLFALGMILALCLGLCACSSSGSSSGSKKDRKSSSDTKDKDKDKDSDNKDDKSSALSDLLGGLSGEKDSGNGSGKDSKGGSSGNSDYRVYCHVATIEDGMLTWQVYEEDIFDHIGVTCSFKYDEGTLQYNWNFIDENAYSTIDVNSPSGKVRITVYSAGGQDDRGTGYVDYSDDVIKLTWDYGAVDVFIAFGDGEELARPIGDVVAGYNNYASGSDIDSGKSGGDSGSSGGSSSGSGRGESDPRIDESIDLSGLTKKHGRGYIYRQTGSEMLVGEKWVYSESDGYIHYGDFTMDSVVMVYRCSDHSEIEFLLGGEDEYGQYSHVGTGFPAKCIYFDNLETGEEAWIEGDQLIMINEMRDGKAIYTLERTYEFTNP